MKACLFRERGDTLGENFFSSLPSFFPSPSLEATAFCCCRVCRGFGWGVFFVCCCVVLFYFVWLPLHTSFSSICRGWRSPLQPVCEQEGQRQRES